ncbi:MAG: hypothetical protein AB1512_02890 [Thermodesulfobacteriota bacterium]
MERIEPKHVDIKSVEFDATEKEMHVTTAAGSFVLGFKREFYFDLILRVAIRQHSLNDRLEISEMTKALTECTKKHDRLPKERKREYGILNLSSIENYWTSHFANLDRKYTIIKERSPDWLTDEDVSRLLLRNNLFSYQGSKQSIRYSLAHPAIKVILPKSIFEGEIQFALTESLLGTKKTELIPVVKDVEQGYLERDIIVEILQSRIDLPREIKTARQRLFEERERAIKRGEEFVWPGTTFGIQSFAEQRTALTERIRLYFTLRPTDYFTFKAIQDNLDKKVVKDDFGQPQTLRERYLSDINPFVPVPEMAQSISATVLLLCEKDGRQIALLARRSKRVATGRDVFVLSINETPKRRPTPEELKFLEDVPKHRLEPDTNRAPNPFFNALRRGAKEELGIELPKKAFKVLTFGLEPRRYMYVLIGIAETKLTPENLMQAFSAAKDASLEYAGFYFVDFIPEAIYDFMRGKEWGSEAELGLFHALIHKHGYDRVQRVFSSYPLPRF